MYESMLNHPTHLFGSFERLRRELDDAFCAPGGLPRGVRPVAPGTLPAINVARAADSVEVQAFAPGLDASKIDVTLDRGVLRIAGERAGAAGAGGGDARQQVHARERGTGRFARSVALPDDVDPERIDADYRDGVLRIRIARRAAAQPRRITVQ